MSIGGQMSKQNMVYMCDGVLFNFEKEEILTHTTAWKKLENTIRRNSHKKRVYFHLYNICRVSESQSQGQKVDWLSEIGWRQEWIPLLNGHIGSVWQDEKSGVQGWW